MNLLERLFNVFQGTAVVHPKIGFHCGPGGNPTGIGDHLRRLDAAGVPFFIKSTDSMTGLFDAQLLMVNSSVPHTAVFRRSVPYEGAAPIENPDVPDYTLSPQEAAERHWAWHKAGLPPELNRQLIWIETVNELRKEPEWGDWLGNFATETALLMNAEGYKFAAFGFSSGTPEPESWETPGMLRYLRYCEQHPDLAAVALHEYSFKVEDIWFERGYHIGRFEALFAACDKHGIKRPNILITEWGWEYQDVPDVAKGVDDVRAVAEYYAQFAEILGAAIWYLGPGFGGIANQAQRLIGPVTDMTIATTFPAPVEPPPIEPPITDIGLPRIDYARTVFVAPQEADRAAWLAICEAAYANRRSVGFSYDDAGIGALSKKTAVLYGIPLERQAEFLAWYETYYPGTAVLFENTPPPAAGDPFAGLEFGQPLNSAWVTVLGGEFDARRDYSAFGGLVDDKHEGIDAAPTVGGVVRVLNVWPGVVTNIGLSAGYGRNLTIQHEYEGRVFYTRRAHLESISATVGQPVEKGAVLGVCGSTGNSSGRHDHLTMTSPDYGMAGYIVADVVDPTPYYPESNAPAEDVYTGPTVTFQAGVDQPASDWRWPQARVVFEKTGLYPKYHAGGNNHNWFEDYKSPLFNLVRILVAPDYAGDLLDETRNNIAQFFSRGARDFEVLNEPNLEGMGVRWNNGAEFGMAFRLYCKDLKEAFPGIRLWFPGMSPGFGAQYAFIDDAASMGAFDHVVGICEHVYTGIVDDGETAVNQMVNEVMEFRRRYALKRPMVVSEFSVNRPAAADYKAAVYHAFYDSLAAVAGVQAAYSYTSDWGDGAGEDGNQEGWLRWGIAEAW